MIFQRVMNKLNARKERLMVSSCKMIENFAEILELDKSQETGCDNCVWWLGLEGLQIQVEPDVISDSLTVFVDVLGLPTKILYDLQYHNGSVKMNGVYFTSKPFLLCELLGLSTDEFMEVCNSADL